MYGRVSIPPVLTCNDSIRPTSGHETGFKTSLSGALSVKAHCLPFSQIPHTTRLFTDLLAYTPQIQPFYPRSPHFRDWVQEEAANLRYDSARRQQVADILERQYNDRQNSERQSNDRKNNDRQNASAKTLANINRFRKGAAAVVTGQQVGLFGGPMFDVYKALTAVKLANEATAAGVECIPIFWLASYDHDLAEVNHVSLPGAEGALQTLATSSHGAPGAPVSTVRLGDEILPVVEQAAALLGDTEITSLLRETYRPGETLSTAFAQLFARLFTEWGVIVLDASDPELHRVAEPIYRAAIERADELAAAVLARGQALEGAGYHQQVKVTPSSVLMFTIQNGARTAIHHHSQSEIHQFTIGSDDGAEKISQADLLRRLSGAPGQFSPNVLLRPIVEDYLLPTLAYTGGAAEVAYYGQAGAVFEKLLGRVTPVVPRFSATIVEPKIQRLLERHGIAVPAVFAGPEALRRQLAAHNLPEDLQAAFDEARKSLDSQLVTITEKLTKLDRTLVDAAETARSKVQYQLERLFTQAARAEAQKGELVTRHAETLSQALYPEKELQERGVGCAYFLARYGRELLGQLYEAIHSDCPDHQILEL
jgi:bacillithiol synthase